MRIEVFRAFEVETRDFSNFLPTRAPAKDLHHQHHHHHTIFLGDLLQEAMDLLHERVHQRLPGRRRLSSRVFRLLQALLVQQHLMLTTVICLYSNMLFKRLIQRRRARLQAYRLPWRYLPVQFNLDDWDDQRCVAKTR